MRRPECALILCLLMPFLLRGEDEALRTWNTRVLRGDASEALAARAKLMERTIRERPGEALRLAFPEKLARALRARHPEGAAMLEAHGARRGRIDHVVLEDVQEGRAEHRVRLVEGDTLTELRFPEGMPEGLTCGQEAEAEGVSLGGEMAVRSITTAGPPACSALGAQKLLVVPVVFPGQSLPEAVSRELLEEAFLGDGPWSVRSFWRQVSVGRAWVEGRVLAPVPVSRTYSCDEYWALWDEVRRRIDTQVDFGAYQRVFIVMPRPAGCAWSGMATVGCRLTATGEGEVPLSVSWLVAHYMTTVQAAAMLGAHEGGHNLGLLHAASRDFGPETLGPPGAPGILNEYGDRFSSMGFWNFEPYSARHRLQLGWLDAPDVPAAELAGSYDLEPPRALRVPRGNAYLWLEPRVVGGQTVALGHYEDSTTGGRTHLLDFAPGTPGFEDAPGSPGLEWRDAYSDLVLRLESGAGQRLRVGVWRSAAPCVEREPKLEFMPEHAVGEPRSRLRLQLRVTNRDSAGCGPSLFHLNAETPDGGIAQVDSGELPLSPGEEIVVEIEWQAPEEPGTFPLRAVVTRAGHQTAAYAECTLVEQENASDPLNSGL